MSKVLLLQHIACETPGTIGDALAAAGIAVQHVRTFEGQPVPQEMGDAAGLIVMGGPMGVYDGPRYPFLTDEMRLIGQALRAERPVLGVCLGSQLLAATLGARVTKGKQKEIGWHPVALAEAAGRDALWTGLDSPVVAYHWHGDVFALPRDAVSLAASDLTAHQAFRYGRGAYGLLFHMEITGQMIGDMVAEFTDELRAAGIDGRAIVDKAADYLPPLQAIGALVFQRWAALIQ